MFFFLSITATLLWKAGMNFLLTVPKQLGTKFSIHIAKIIRAELSKVKNRRRLKSIVSVLVEKNLPLPIFIPIILQFIQLKIPTGEATCF